MCDASEDVRFRNKLLCERFPFLIPRNSWSGKRITTKEKGYYPGDPDVIPEYDYEWTELDSMPKGWRIAFGVDFMEELLKACEETNFTDELGITQIKEKYGGLRFYVYGAPQEVHDVIHKYEDKSYNYCQVCGKPGKLLWRGGWAATLCPKCAEKFGYKWEDDEWAIQQMI